LLGNARARAERVKYQAGADDDVVRGIRVSISVLRVKRGVCTLPWSRPARIVANMIWPAHDCVPERHHALAVGRSSTTDHASIERRAEKRRKDGVPGAIMARDFRFVETS